MAYYQSNEPYNKKDGIGNGLMLGAAAGATGYYGAKSASFYKQFNKMEQSHKNNMADKLAMELENSTTFKGLAGTYKKGQNIAQQTFADANPNYAESKQFKVFGRGKSRAIAGGVSILAGGLLGAGIDAMNKPG